MTIHKKSVVIIATFVLLATVTLGFVLLLGSEKPQSTTVKPPTPRTSEPRTPTQTQPDGTATDNRRRTAASATLAMLQSYASDNTGSYPKTTAELRQAVDTYGKTIASSTIVVYRQSYDPADTPKPTDMFYYPGYTCTGNDPTPSSSRSVAVRYTLSDGSYACSSK